MAENRTKRIPGDFSTEGRLTKEPAKKNTKNGEEFVVFDIACNIGYGDNQETTFFSCSAFGSLVKLIEKAKKGSFVHVGGELSIENYQKNDGSEGKTYRIRCNSFRFLNTGNGEKKSEQTQPQQNYQGQQYAPQYAPQGQQYAPQGQQYAPQGQQYAPQQRQQPSQGQQYAPQQRQQPSQGLYVPPQGQYQQPQQRQQYAPQPQQPYSDYPDGYQEMPADQDLPF